MKWLALAGVALAALVLAVVLGPAHVPMAELSTSPIVRDLRAPRALLAFLVGGALGTAGASLQALVRNPLADPYLLGLSGGAGLGAVAAIALHAAGPWALPIAAFAGALGAMGLVYRLGLVGGAELDPRVLILAGVAVGAFAAAVTTALVSVSDAAELRNAFLWLWGGLSGASWDTVRVMAIYAPLPLAVLYTAARSLDRSRRWETLRRGWATTRRRTPCMKRVSRWRANWERAGSSRRPCGCSATSPASEAILTPPWRSTKSA